jgi:excinuclease UvrABC ATPase subunit
MENVIIKDKCLACFGVGKLRTFSTPEPKTLCPWCNGIGQVEDLVNEVFLRVKKATPAPVRMCTVFGAGDLPPTINVKSKEIV